MELVTRIDERLKAIKENCTTRSEWYTNLEERLAELEREHGHHTVAIQALSVNDDKKEIESCQKALVELDKRLTPIEMIVKGHQSRWEKIGSLIFQFIWVILLAWLLSMLHLQSPPS